MIADIGSVGTKCKVMLLVQAETPRKTKAASGPGLSTQKGTGDLKLTCPTCLG